MTDPVKLLPCPFCGGEASLDLDGARRGTPRQSCIVVCLDCGARRESSDEGDLSGSAWNKRHLAVTPVAAAPEAVPASPWPSRPPDFNRWYADAARFLAFVHAHPRAWCRDGRMKYLNVLVDTRSGHFRLMVDHEHGEKEISPDEFVAAAVRDGRPGETIADGPTRHPAV